MDNKCLGKIRLLGKEIRVDNSNIQNMRDIVVTGCYILKNSIYFIVDSSKGNDIIKARIDERLAKEVISDGCIEIEYDSNTNYIHIDLAVIENKWYTYDIIHFDNGKMGIVDRSKVVVYQIFDTKEFGMVFYIAAGAAPYVINDKLQLFLVPHDDSKCKTLHINVGNGTSGLKIREANIEEVDWFMGSN